MSVWRRTVAQLAYSYDVGVWGEPGHFVARGLQASARIGGWNRGVFLRNASVDSSLPSTYLFAQARARAVADRSDPESWVVSAAVYAVDGSETPANARAEIMRRGSATALAEVEFVADAARAGKLQADADQIYNGRRAETPWITDAAYAGDFAAAQWAQDLSGSFGVFPINLLKREYPPFLHMFAALKPPPGWPSASLVLANPTPIKDRFELFSVGARENEVDVTEDALLGRREALCTVRIGSKDEIDAEKLS
ncbi:hypothetical protein SAMN05216368_11366 [Cryobacterium flavum]|uniref:Uncharacterized protein n=1 Tax=Cryobacterium flavum TaxID=1424659 RepID=A0A4R8V6A6_9MICO|nr:MULTISPECIES: hypothetical protein [Cryobacterium]TFB78007.1 hypothetical protein E3O21_07000 [Cryobacterium flavum]SDO25438.1 hypothetical protein SAMN05216368_11366 [Cryobacterium flavum]